jgi:hypothetical protein
MLRRLVAAGAVISVFGTTAASVPAASPGASQPIRHEDPAAATVDAQPGAALEYFLAIFSRLNTRQYEESRHLIRRLDRASLPPDVQAVVSDLNDLMVREGGLVEVVERWVRDITALEQAGRTGDAQRLLIQLNDQVRRADLLFAAMSGGIQDLRGRTEGALTADPVQRQAFDQLQRAAARVKVFLAVTRATAKSPATVAAVGRLLPYETLILLDAPQTAYPGRLVVISGTVQERAPSPSRGRRLMVYLDGVLVAEAPAKAFHIPFTMPDDIVTGPHQLLAEVPTQGRYLGAREGRTIRVARVIPNVVAHAGTWVVVPGRLIVSGSVTSELGPLRHAAVRVSLGGQPYQTTTSELGTFRVSSNLPATLSLIGSAALSVLIVPDEPWVAPITQDQRILVINLASLGLLAAVLMVGGVLLFRRTGRRALAEVLREVPAAPPPAPAQWPRAKTPVRIDGPLAQELLAIYQQILRRIETTAGARAGGSTTLREFVRRVPQRLGGDPLWRMTELAELALYSHHPITPALVEQARALGTQLEGALVGA